MDCLTRKPMCLFPTSVQNCKRPKSAVRKLLPSGGQMPIETGSRHRLGLKMPYLRPKTPSTIKSVVWGRASLEDSLKAEGTSEIDGAGVYTEALSFSN